MSSSSGTTTTSSASSGGEAKPIIRNKDMIALKRYITSKDTNPRYGLHETTIKIDLTHSNLIQKHIEIRFDKSDTIYDVKTKIHQKTGTAPHFQTLHLKCNGQTLFELNADDDANAKYDHYKLGYFFNDDLAYGDGLEIYCIDINPLSGSKNGQYENVNLIKKYKMTEEDYNTRKGTLRDWATKQKENDSNFTLAKHAKEHREKCEAKRQLKLGIFPLPYNYVVDSTGNDIIKEFDDDDHIIQNDNKDDDDAAAAAATAAEYDEKSILHITIGSRCQVQPGSRRGVVAYVGLVPEFDFSTTNGGYWIGIKFDEPVGKTDGSINNRTYFEAQPGYASFVRGKNVQIGNYPELDDCLDDSDFEDSDSDDEL